MRGENLSTNPEENAESNANPWAQVAEEVGGFDPDQARQNIAEAQTVTQETETPEPTFEVTREEIVPGVEIILPETSAIDKLLADHSPKLKHDFEHDKPAWEQRPVKLTESDEHHVFVSVESVYASSHGTHQSTEQAIDAAKNNQLRYLERKMNGYYDDHQYSEEEDLAKLRSNADNLRQRPMHETNIDILESQVNHRLREAKLQAAVELYNNANVIDKWQLKRAGIEDEIKALREFNFDDFKEAEQEAAERAQYEAENIFTPGAAAAVNATQDTLDKIGGEVHSPDIISEELTDETDLNNPETDQSTPKLTAEGISASTIDNLHDLAQTHSKEELMDRIYAEDWIDHFDDIVRELFDGDYGLGTQATIVDHMSREEVSKNLDDMLKDNTFDAQTLAKKLGQLTPEEAYVFRSNGLGNIADALEVKSNNPF